MNLLFFYLSSGGPGGHRIPLLPEVFPQTAGPVCHFVTVVVGAVTAVAVGAAGAVATGAVRGATGTAASASTATGAAGSQQAGFSGAPASTTAGASTFFSQPTRANAATNTIELIANLIFFLLNDQRCILFGRLSLFITQDSKCIQKKYFVDITQKDQNGKRLTKIQENILVL